MKFSHLLIVFFISIIISLSLFPRDFFISGDGELHLARIASYTQALKAGHFPVRWAKDLNYKYGYPIFNFVYPLPYLVASIFNILSFNIFTSLKLTFFLSFLLSGIGMYLWLGKKFGHQAGLISACFYILAPYRLIDVYFRAALGEAFIFIFPPFVLYFWEKFQDGERQGYCFLTALFYAFLILSHNALSLIFSLFFLFYAWFYFKKREFNIFTLFLPFAFGLLFSSFFWLPALVESKYTMVRSPLFIKNYAENFVTLKQLVIPIWKYKEGVIPYQIGMASLLFFLIFVIRLPQIKEKRLSYLVIFMFLFSIFMMMPVSNFLWANIGILKDFQIPTRFLSLTLFTTSLFTAIVLPSFKRRQKILAWLFILLALVEAIGYVRPKEYLNLEEDFYKNYPKSTTWHQEGTPIWVGSEADAYAETFLTSPDKVVFRNVLKKQTKHQFEVEAEKDSLIVDNTLYFPGWRVLVDGKKDKIEFQDSRFRGLITFKVPAGKHKVEVFFGRSKIRLVAELMSLTSFLIAVFFLVFTKIKYKKIF